MEKQEWQFILTGGNKFVEHLTFPRFVTKIATPAAQSVHFDMKWKDAAPNGEELQWQMKALEFHNEAINGLLNH
jgi:hypothetical protein